MRRWLEANPHDDFAPEVRQQLTTAPLHHVTGPGNIRLGRVCPDGALTGMSVASGRRYRPPSDLQFVVADHDVLAKGGP